MKPIRAHARLLALTLLSVVLLTWMHYQPESLHLSWSTWLGVWCVVLMLVLLSYGFTCLKILRFPFAVDLLYVLLWSVACLSYTQYRIEQRLEQTVEPEWLHQTVLLKAEIVGLPIQTPYGLRVLVKSIQEQTDERLIAASVNHHLPEQISVNWYDKDLPQVNLKVGQVWLLPVELKPTHATSNPATFDQEKQWWAQNIRALGVVRVKDHHPVLIEQKQSLWIALQHWRAYTLDRISAVLSNESTETRAVFRALVLGDQSAVTNNQWQLFQQTGITHLVSISGVHITMLAVIAMWLTSCLWRKSVTLCEWMPSLHAGQWLGLLVAVIYTLVAGWALPAQRTVAMLGLWLLLSRLGVAQTGIRTLCYSLLFFIGYDPFVVLTASFWLSYGAVAWLILGFSKFDSLNEISHRKLPLYQRVGRFAAGNVVTGLSLLPISAYFFRQASLSGVLINLIAIPFVSTVLTPLMLCATLLLSAFGWGLPVRWMGQILDGSLSALSQINQLLPFGLLKWSLTLWELAGLIVLSFGLVYAVRQRMRWAMVLMSVLTLTLVLITVYQTPKAQDGYVHVHVLDVGQGSAVVVQSKSQVWVYDTGPQYGPDADAGLRILLPFLQSLKINKIDTLILSHDDLDHTGGAASLSRGLLIDRVISSITAERLKVMGVHAKSFNTCQAGQIEQYDQLKVSVLSPSTEVMQNPQSSDNQKSCVMRWDWMAGGAIQSLLLAGDIDALQEARLVNAPTGGVRNWHADVVLMPHHGSEKSSSLPWVEATTPHFAIAQAGFMNHFHHPAPSVVERYLQKAARVFNTAYSGEVSFCMGCKEAGLQEWRKSLPFVWTDRTARSTEK